MKLQAKKRLHKNGKDVERVISSAAWYRKTTAAAICHLGPEVQISFAWLAQVVYTHFYPVLCFDVVTFFYSCLGSFF